MKTGLCSSVSGKTTGKQLDYINRVVDNRDTPKAARERGRRTAPNLRTRTADQSLKPHSERRKPLPRAPVWPKVVVLGTLPAPRTTAVGWATPEPLIEGARALYRTVARLILE